MKCQKCAQKESLYCLESLQAICSFWGLRSHSGKPQNHLSKPPIWWFPFLKHLVLFSECVDLILLFYHWLLLVRQYWVKPEKTMMKYCQEKTMRSVNNGHKVILRLETWYFVINCNVWTVWMLHVMSLFIFDISEFGLWPMY